MIYVGVDCGLSGALVAIMPSGEVQWWDCPTIKTEKGKANLHDRRGMSGIVRQLAAAGEIVAVVEAVHFDPRDELHKRSAEVLIRSAECWLTLLEFHNATIHHLTPIEWRSKLNLAKGMDKSGYVSEAIKRFPEYRFWIRYEWSGKMAEKDGRAEALLMAHLAMNLSEEGIVAS